jgi:hypothetical protein
MPSDAAASVAPGKMEDYVAVRLQDELQQHEFHFERESSRESSASEPKTGSTDSALGGSFQGQPQAHHQTSLQTSDVPSFVGNQRLRALVRANHPALSGLIKPLADRLWTVVLTKTLQSGVGARGVLDVESSHEELDSGRPVLRVYLDASAPQALAFWDGLESELDRWLEHLNDKERDIALGTLALRVHWNP